MKEMISEHPYQWQWDKTRYQRAFLWGGQSESEVQADSVEALRISKIDVEVVDSGSGRLRIMFMSALKSFGLGQDAIKTILGRVRNVAPSSDPGRSDLSGCLAPNGRAFYIEMKAPAKLDPVTGNVLRTAGKPTAEQLGFLNRRHVEGAICGVAWSANDCFEILGKENILAHQRALRENQQNGTNVLTSPAR